MYDDHSFRSWSLVKIETERETNRYHLRIETPLPHGRSFRPCYASFYRNEARGTRGSENDWTRPTSWPPFKSVVPTLQRTAVLFACHKNASCDSGVRQEPNGHRCYQTQKICDRSAERRNRFLGGRPSVEERDRRLANRTDIFGENRTSSEWKTTRTPVLFIMLMITDHT